MAPVAQPEFLTADLQAYIPGLKGVQAVEILISFVI